MYKLCSFNYCLQKKGWRLKKKGKKSRKVKKTLQMQKTNQKKGEKMK